MRPLTTLTIPQGPRTGPKWASPIAVSGVQTDFVSPCHFAVKEYGWACSVLGPVLRAPSGTCSAVLWTMCDSSLTCVGGRAQELQDTLDSTE